MISETRYTAGFDVQLELLLSGSHFTPFLGDPRFYAGIGGAIVQWQAFETFITSMFEGLAQRVSVPFSTKRRAPYKDKSKEFRRILLSSFFDAHPTDRSTLISLLDRADAAAWQRHALTHGRYQILVEAEGETCQYFVYYEHKGKEEILALTDMFLKSLHFEIAHIIGGFVVV